MMKKMNKDLDFDTEFRKKMKSDSKKSLEDFDAKIDTKELDKVLQ